MKSRNARAKIIIVIITLIMTLISSNLNWGKKNWVDILESDARGYYAYLPAIFIYQDLHFGFFDKMEKGKYFNKNLYFDYRTDLNGKVFNKFYCGTALVELPFFLAAHLISYLLHYDMDGYSKPYPVCMNIAALFYLFVGLFFLESTLNLYGLNEIQKSMVLFSCAFGTNLFYYTVCEPGMSHVFSFAFISMFIFFSKNYFLKNEKKYLVWSGIILGIIILIRPVNGLVVFTLPFTAGHFFSLKQGFVTALKNKIHLTSGIVGCLIMVSIQLILYKISTGHFFVYAYGAIGFNFLNSHMMDILFSYRKGLFLYTPVYFISLAGGYFMWKSSKFEFFSWFGFFILITFILSSWWMWYYGGSFSSRVYVDYLSLFMILLGIALMKIKSKFIYSLFTSILVALILICQIQTYQYRYYQIHWSDMNKEKYWDVFLRPDKIKN